MDRISTFNVGADMASLQTALAGGELPAAMREPLQAIVSRVVAASAQHPVAVYVASSDETAPLRDHFAYLLARVLTPQIPSTIVVDCDFLHVGLSGLVPERDALGFLDLLLYGSSLGVITQETQRGVKTIGAGSFPVTKRMPFVLSAFEEAAHRLVHHARCVLFVGPLDDDEGALHPLCGAVDLPLLVRELDAVRPGAVDPIEEQIASQWESELLSVRLVGTGLPSDQMFAELVGDDEEDEFTPLGGPVRRQPEPPRAEPPRAEPPRAEPPPPPMPPAPPPHVPRPPRAEPPVREPLGAEPDLPPRAEPPPMPPPPERTPTAEGPRAERPHAETTRVEKPPAKSPPAPSLADLADPVLSDERVTAGLRPPPLADEPPRKRRRGVRGIVFTVFFIAILVVAGKWFFETRTQAPTEPAETAQSAPAGTPTEAPVPAAADTTAPETTQVAARDTAAAAANRPLAESQEPGPATAGTQEPESEARRAEMTNTGGRSGGTVLIDPDNIHVLQEIKANWPDHYFIHISSFRKSVEARNEVAFLESHEFPVFIVFLDLGAKGKWYRVYAGPFKTRDTALDVKKSLDDLPSVRFTRITKIEE